MLTNEAEICHILRVKEKCWDSQDVFPVGPAGALCGVQPTQQPAEKTLQMYSAFRAAVTILPQLKRAIFSPKQPAVKDLVLTSNEKCLTQI